ncbi:GntR family transcriptional regulator [Brachybacterium sp. JHP9]|uniref:GntR family transcriptional regulator n=1 Tax=Brachybacterium equifaecis TaxID=2910770 RepID=A0ABT0QY20_9MICO|nr:GntR family transcriptional regulator [Brachybacterium equifaecis]MCL6422549.1 GntR family transcriptional regulator [Brachybacterium equifaecis]
MSRILIDLADPTPPYEQIRRGILEQLALGALKAGDRLPTIRALARDLGVAPGTVGRAFKELEEAGVLETRRGGGTTVAASAASLLPQPSAPADAIDEDLLRLAQDFIAASRSDGHEDAAITEAVRVALRRDQPA